MSPRLPRTRTRFPLSHCARNRAPATGTEAVMLSAERLRTLTTPGDWPVTATVGTAANPVTLSGATTTLSENPGRVMEEDCPPEFCATAWLELLTTVKVLFVALNTRVKRLFGNRTIIPG